MTVGPWLIRLLSTWQLVGRRILAHWRLLSPVVVGVLLSSAMMAGTVLYFDSLRDLALQFTLDKLPETDVKRHPDHREGAHELQRVRRRIDDSQQTDGAPHRVVGHENREDGQVGGLRRRFARSAGRPVAVGWRRTGELHIRHGPGPGRNPSSRGKDAPARRQERARRAPGARSCRSGGPGRGLRPGGRRPDSRHTFHRRADTARAGYDHGAVRRLRRRHGTP